MKNEWSGEVQKRWKKYGVLLLIRNIWLEETEFSTVDLQDDPIGGDIESIIIIQVIIYRRKQNLATLCALKNCPDACLPDFLQLLQSKIPRVMRSSYVYDWAEHASSMLALGYKSVQTLSDPFQKLFPYCNTIRSRYVEEGQKTRD
jgi:hypothetical protein